VVVLIVQSTYNRQS